MQDVVELQSLFKKYLDENQFHQKPTGLYEPINYILSLGGKRIRPVLLLMGCNLFNDNIAQALPASMAIEIFHNFSLLHDDIMDEAPLRRGKPTVHVKYNQNTGILSGDVMLVYAYEFFLQLDNKAKIPEIIKTFNQVAIEVCEGQQHDMDFESRNDVSIDEYLKMIEQKTAVLIAGGLKIGAIIGGSQEEDSNHLYEFGRNIGIAFQLQDDILDTYGDPEKFGKKVGGDIVQNKKTFLVIKALELGNEDQRTRLSNLMNIDSNSENAKIEAVKSVFNELQVREAAERLMESYLALAFEHLAAVNVVDEKKKVLINLSHELMGREV
ncbi:MAG: polyprenyl synthetase family protein [Saprospiraceae bacterium]